MLTYVPKDLIQWVKTKSVRGCKCFWQKTKPQSLRAELCRFSSCSPFIDFEEPIWRIGGCDWMVYTWDQAQFATEHSSNYWSKPSKRCQALSTWDADQMASNDSYCILEWHCPSSLWNGSTFCRPEGAAGAWCPIYRYVYAVSLEMWWKWLRNI